MEGSASRELASGNGSVNVFLPDRSFRLFSATGPLDDAAFLLDKLRRNELTKDEIEWMGLDFATTEGTSQAIGSIPGLGSLLSALFDYAADISAQKEAVVVGAALRNNDYAGIMKDTPYGVLGECGFGMSVMLDLGGTDPAAYNDATVAVYVPDGARPLIDAMTDAYSKSSGTPYSTQVFLRDMSQDTVASVVQGEDSNATRDFLTWSGPDPSNDLVHKDGGTPVTSLSNYFFLKYPNASENQNKVFRWELDDL